MSERRIINAADWRALHGLLFVALFATGTFFPALHIWPRLWLVPLALYAGFVAAVPPLRATFRPWRFGRVSAPAIFATLIIAAGSCVVLLMFQAKVRPDLSSFVRFLPATPVGGMVVFGLFFATANALLEEIVFRGILFDAVESQWNAWVAVFVTAILFGLGHMRGYPPGPLGATLACVYALCLGWLRVFAGGLGWPVIAHIVADITIFSIVARAGAI